MGLIRCRRSSCFHAEKEVGIEVVKEVRLLCTLYRPALYTLLRSESISAIFRVMIQEQTRDMLKVQIKSLATRDGDSTACRSDSSTSIISECNDEYANPAESPLVSSTSCRLGKKVNFSTLEIREYAIIPGDNPGGSCGCPLTIAWEYDCEFRFPIDEYEENRAPSRSMTQLSMPPRVREEKLRGVGFSRKEIQESTKYANIARLQRRRTTETLNLAPIQEFLERAKRKTLHLVGAGTKRKERELMRRVQASPLVEKYEGNLRNSAATVPLDASMLSFNDC